MPQLPIINADSRAAIFVPPRLGPEYFGAGAARSLDEFGQTLLVVGKKLQDQQDELQYASAVGRLDAGLDTIRQQLKQDPDYASHPQKFQAQAGALQADIAKDLTRRSVQAAFAAHASKTLPMHGVQVQADALSLWNSAQVADLDKQGLASLDLVAKTPSPDVRDEQKTLMNDLITRAEKRGVLRPADAELRRERFVRGADKAALEAIGEVNPRQALADLNDPAQKWDLREQDRWALIRTLHAKVRMEDEEEQHRLNRENEAFAGSLALDILQGKYTQNGQIDKDAIYAQLQGKPFPVVSHVESVTEAAQHRIDMADSKTSAQVSARYQNALFDAYQKSEDLTPIIQNAQMDAAKGGMNETGMEGVWRVMTRLDAMNEAGERRAESAERRADMDAQRAERAQLAAQGKRVKEAMTDLDSWFPSIKDPGMALIAGDYYRTRNGAREVALSAAQEGRDPVQAVREARTSLVLSLYGSAEAAIKARSGPLEKYPTTESLKNANLPLAEKVRLIELAREREQLKQYLGANPPPQAGANGRPGQQSLPGN